MKISIAIPAYKAKFLRRAIDSVLAQKYKCFELIILNDNSPEDLDLIVKDYLDCKRVKYCKNSVNVGSVNLVDNWNQCLQLAEGDYFLCMGDDDELEPNCLEHYHSLIEQYPDINLFHSLTKIIDENSNVFHMQEARPLWESVYSLIWHRMNCSRIQYIGDFLFKTSSLREVGGFYKLPLAWGTDDITSCLCALKTGVINTQIPLFRYRMTSITISNSANAKIKYSAVCSEYDFFSKFLSTSTADSDLDKIYQRLSLDSIEKFYLKKRIITIAEDLNSNFMKNLLYWLGSLKRLKLSLRIIFMSIGYCVYRKCIR